jgi:hypothetical protein
MSKRTYFTGHPVCNQVIKPKSVIRSAIIRGYNCNTLKNSCLRNCFSNGGH